MHPESVLLVDHHQAQILECDLLLEQRMGADQNVDTALLERVHDLGALAAFLAAGEQRDAQAASLAERADGPKVLARQQLGRRHQCGLRAGLDRSRHGQQRHHRFAAADIALQQTKHALRTVEVGIDFGQRADLGTGEGEGQSGEKRLAELSGGGEPPSRAPLEPGADHGKRKLVCQQLVISEPRPRRR